MPSEHSAAAWAIASVIAHEYPGPLTTLLIYSFASAISMARVTGKQHFNSDVFIGGAIGWYAGKQAYRAHHDPEVGGTEWQSYGEFTNLDRTPELAVWAQRMYHSVVGSTPH